jgi:hypothetical protein
VISVCLCTVQRIKQETGVEIRMPQEEGGSNIIRIEGPKEGLEVAKKELLDLASKMVRLHYVASIIIIVKGEQFY